MKRLMGKLESQLNAVIRKHKLVMFESINGKIFRLVDHYKYLDYRKAKREFVCNGKLKQQFTYLYHRL